MTADKPKGRVEATESQTGNATQQQAAANLYQDSYRDLKPAAPKQDVSKISYLDFSQDAQKVFGTIDKDRNGFLSKSELAAAVEDKKFTGKDAQIVAALYKNAGKLEDLHNDEYGPEIRGVSRADLTEFGNVAKRQSETLSKNSNVDAWKENGFDAADKNKDGFLTRKEIDQALAGSKDSPTSQSALNYLKDNYDKVQSANNDEWGFDNDGITKKDIAAHRKEVGSKTSEAKAVNGVDNGLDRTQKSQNTPGLFADSANPLASITPDAVNQGNIGNCYFEAALGAMAKSNPQAIKDMIKDNHDGTYTVTFPGAKNEPITIKAPTEAEQGVYNNGEKHGSWASVMEKAYGQYCQEHFWRRGPLAPFGGNTTIEGSDGGGRPNAVQELLTGRSTDSDYLIATSMATTQRKLTEAFSANPPRPVTAGITPGLYNLIGETSYTTDKYPTAHAYSILNFDPSGPDGGTVTVRNPWGWKDDSPNGTSKISLKKFMSNFSEISYGE